MSDAIELQRVFPQAVHDSLAELRRIARAATSKDDPTLRKATADEIALALTIKKPWHCTGHSSRTGLPCTLARVKGLGVCKKHGGALKHVLHAAKRRLAEAAPELLESQITTALQRENLMVGQKAGSELLDRAGFGALVQAKIRASKREQSNGAQVVVNIGFLG